MSAVRQSIAFSMVDKYLTQVLVIATTAIMARILTPAQTGLYLTANALVLLAENFRLFGVGIYIVQQPTVDRALLRSAFTVTLVISMGCSALIYFGAHAVSAFYGTPELEALFAVAALGFLVLPFSSPIIALLQRDLAFKALACINIAGGLVAALFTILLGKAGFGPVSYMWGTLAANVVVVGLALMVRPEFGIFRPSLATAPGLLSFGLWSSMITVSNQAYELLPRLAFGKILGFGDVGLYSRAIVISLLPDRVLSSALQPVVLPALAAHMRSGGSAREIYLRGVNLMSAVQWPALIMVALLADPIVHVLLGPQWTAAPPLVRIMALANMALVPGFMTFPVLVAAGRIRDALYASVISLPPSFLIVVGAAFIGLQAVALSLLIVAPLQMAVAYLFIRRAIDLPLLALLREFRHGVILTIGTAFIPGLIVALNGSGFDLGWVQTIAAIVGGAAGWFVTLFLVEHPLMEELLQLRRALARRLSRSPGTRPTIATPAE